MGRTCVAPATAPVSLQDKTRQDKTRQDKTSLLTSHSKSKSGTRETKASLATEPQTARGQDLDLEMKNR